LQLNIVNKYVEEVKRIVVFANFRYFGYIKHYLNWYVIKIKLRNTAKIRIQALPLRPQENRRVGGSECRSGQSGRNVRSP
jgi:hypothetical protein